MYYSAPPTVMYDLAHGEGPTRSGPGSRRAGIGNSRSPILASISISAWAAAPRVGWLRSLRCWASQTAAAFSARAKAAPKTADCASP
jgi:hypothetical protein